MMKDRIKTLIRFLCTWALSLCGGVLVMTAALHRLQLSSAGYTSSPLIDVEMTLIIFILLFLVAQPPLAVFRCFKKQWRRIGIIGINTVIGIAALIAAMIIDSPTILHMT
jgi:hypothetical protein